MSRQKKPLAKAHALFIKRQKAVGGSEANAKSVSGNLQVSFFRKCVLKDRGRLQPDTPLRAKVTQLKVGRNDLSDSSSVWKQMQGVERHEQAKDEVSDHAKCLPKFAKKIGNH